MGATFSNRKSSSENQEDDVPFVINWKAVDGSTTRPQYVETLLKGITIPGMDGDLDLPPSDDWVDRDLLRRGREVLNQQLTLLVLPFFLMLAVTTYIPSLFRTVYRSGKNPRTTPHFCYKRVLKTSMDVCSWIQSDMLDSETPGYKSMRKARFLHRSFFRFYNKSKRGYYDEMFSNDNLDNLSGEEGASVRILGAIEKDLRTQVKAPLIPIGPPEAPEALYVNQLEMALTSAIVLAFALSKRQMLRIDTVEKRKAVIYFVRMLNYNIGIQDEFNFAIGDVEEVQQNLSDIFVYIMGPHIRSPNVTVRRYFAVTVKDMVSDMYMPFLYIPAFLLMGDYLQVELPSVWAMSRWYHRLAYHMVYFFYAIVNNVSLARKIADGIFKYFQNNYMNDFGRYN